MKCFTCETVMENIDYINDISVRIYWKRCPKCNSEAEMHYVNSGEYVSKVIWSR